MHTEKYTVEIQYGTHDLPFIEQIHGAKLNIEKHNNTFVISGNSEGLLFLAHNLIALATMSFTSAIEGYHIHLDDMYSLNAENNEFILRKEE